MQAMSARDKKAKVWATFNLNTQPRLLSNNFSLLVSPLEMVDLSRLSLSRESNSRSPLSRKSIRRSRTGSSWRLRRSKITN